MARVMERKLRRSHSRSLEPKQKQNNNNETEKEKKTPNKKTLGRVLRFLRVYGTKVQTVSIGHPDGLCHLGALGDSQGRPECSLLTHHKGPLTAEEGSPRGPHSTAEYHLCSLFSLNNYLSHTCHVTSPEPKNHRGNASLFSSEEEFGFPDALIYFL